MFIQSVAAAAAGLALAGAAQASTLVQWNFNASPADNNTATGTLNPAVGAGVAGTLGGASSAFFSGSANGGSSDTTASDNSAWSLSTFAAKLSGDKSRGAQFLFSTVGFEDLVFTYDVRHSDTAPATEVVQYTLDGSSFIDIAAFTATAGNVWNKARSIDFSSISGADNNANFGVRVVAGFGSNGDYAATAAGASYGSSGTWRIDQVSLAGTALPVPEPETYALLLAGLAVVGLARRRPG